MDLEINFSKIEDAAQKFKNASQNISDGTQGNKIGNYLNNPVINNLSCASFLRSLGGRLSSGNNGIARISKSIADIRRKIESVDKTPNNDLNLLLVENEDYFALYNHKLIIIKEKMNDAQENLNKLNKIYADFDPSVVMLHDGKTLKDYNDLQQKYINQFKILFNEKEFISKYCMNESLDAWRTTNRDVKNDILEAFKSWSEDISQSRVDVVIQAGNMIGKGITYSQPESQPDAINPKHLDCSDYMSVSFYRSGYNLFFNKDKYNNYKPTLNCFTGNFVTVAGNYMIGDKTVLRPFSPLKRENGDKNYDYRELIPGDVGLNLSSENHVGLYIGTVNRTFNVKKGTSIVVNENYRGETETVEKVCNVWFHCAGSINGGSSGPQVMIDVKGNEYLSHHYEYLFWDSYDTIKDGVLLPEHINIINEVNSRK